MSVLQAYKSVFGGHSGQVVLEDLKQAHYINSATTGHPIDPYTLAFNEGQRNVILRIMAILQSKEEDYGRDTREPGLHPKRTDADQSVVNAAVDALFAGSVK